MVPSGLAMLAAGLAWRLAAGGGLDHTTLKTKRVVTYGVQRTTNLLMMVGVIWAGFGVYELVA
jgi:hypothetical protein